MIPVARIASAEQKRVIITVHQPGLRQGPGILRAAATLA